MNAAPESTRELSPELPKSLLNNRRLSTWVNLGPSGEVTVRIGKVELGQGILTAVAQLVADELDVPVTCVAVLPAHTALGPNQGLTAGSMSVFETSPAVRLVCAHVRALLLTEAARRLSVDVDDLSVDAGTVHHRDSRRAVTYDELATAVDLDVDVSGAMVPKSVESLTVVGDSTPRLDLPAKVFGQPRFIADIRQPGQQFGRVVRPAVPGGRLDVVDESVVSDLDVQVVREGSFLGVVSPREVVAEIACERLRASARWSDGENLPDEKDLLAHLTSGPHETIELDDTVNSDRHGVGQPNSEGGTFLTATYSRPFLAHASLAPSCGIARWEPDGTLSVWSHSQGIHNLRDSIAQALDIDPGSVRVEHSENAGCYGHNAADDAAFDAVLLARAVPGVPVQVRWSRHDELSWAPFGSAMAAQVAAHVDEAGRVRSWAYDVWSHGHTTRPGYLGVPGLLADTHLRPTVAQPVACDPPLEAGGGTTRNAIPLYDVGSRRVTGHRMQTMPLRTSALRSLGAHLNVFAIECFLDELSEAVGEDPVVFRLRHLSDQRARAVVEKAAEASSWGTALEESVGRGIGFARYKERGAYCAVVAEVETGSKILVRRLTVAVDVGLVVNPDGVRNQIEGGAVQSTSWTTKESVSFDRTRVTSVDWETYPILRFSEVPQVDVHILDRPDLPSVGSGEAAQGPTAAAIANAVSASLGVRVRDLPLTPEAVIATIEQTGR